MVASSRSKFDGGQRVHAGAHGVPFLRHGDARLSQIGDERLTRLGRGPKSCGHIALPQEDCREDDQGRQDGPPEEPQSGNVHGERDGPEHEEDDGEDRHPVLVSLPAHVGLRPTYRPGR